MGELQGNLIKYYCDKALASMSLLADLGLVELGGRRTGVDENRSDTAVQPEYQIIRLIVDPDISTKTICTFERCSTFWRHVLAPQLQRYVDARQAVQDALTTSVDSSRLLVLSRYLKGTEKLAAPGKARFIFV